jgi:hypothetical protein
MDCSTIEHGRECADCLRWSIPVLEDDDCPHCLRLGRPGNPNRLRYLAVKNGMSLREVGRRAHLNWRTVRRISQGEVVPRKSTERKLLKAMGIPLRKSEVMYMFPHSRHV